MAPQVIQGDEVLIRRDPVTGDVILTACNKSFAKWTKLGNRLFHRILPETLCALDHIRDSGLQASAADAVHCKLAELDLTERDIADAETMAREVTEDR